MKKIFTYIFILTALFAVSCTERTQLQEDGLAITFEAVSTDLQTRAAGEDTYQENTISTIDWFFFSDEEGTQLVHYVRTEGNALKLDPLTGDLEPLQKTSYLYAVANYPDEATIASKKTLEELKALPVSTAFTRYETDDEGSSALKLDAGKFNFIMDTYDKETEKYLFQLTPQTFNDTRKITVPLTRLAVKISVRSKIQKTVSSTDSFGNDETWTPVLSQTDFDVYMVDALKAGYLHGEPIRREEQDADFQAANYFTYGRNLATVEELDEEGDYYVWQNVDPFYTYPQTWNQDDNREPFIKVILPWMSDKKGSSEFHYKIVLPDPEDGVFTLERNNWYQVTATIKVLGGTENDYVLVDDVLCSVGNWADPGWLSGSGLNSAVFFDVPTKEFHVYSMDSFDIPIKTNSSANAYITEVAFSDYSTSPTTELVYSTKVIGSNQSTVPATVFTSGLDDDDRSYGGKEYEYSVSPDVTDKYNKKIVFRHSMTDIYVKRDITIKIVKDDDTNKYATVIIHQHPAIELKKQGAGDVFVNGRFARVKDATFGISYTNNQGTFKHSGNGNSTSRIDEYVSRVNNNNYRGGQLQYGTITKGTNVDSSISTDWYTTDIAVTAFSSSNNSYSTNSGTVYYKIGDPRVSANVHYTNWSLDNYLTGIGSPQTTGGYNSVTWYEETTEAWTNASNIKICSQSENDRNVISPHFLISSALNANTGLTKEKAVKRAATYQEAGYPAGRWRLPTEAEVAFIIARQNDGTIPTLYATNSTYWTGSGRTVQTTTGTQTITFADRSSTETHSCRFVYDLWYWGDEPMSTNQYHPNQHIEN